MFRFIDWLMVLPEEMERIFGEELRQIEEDKKMPYVTSVERIGIEKGMQQGMQQGIQQGIQQGEMAIIKHQLTRRFGQLPEWANERLAQASSDELKLWADRLLDAASIDEIFI